MAKEPRYVNKTKRLAGRIGGYRLAATRDSRETTKPAREAFNRRFLDEVDPERKLPASERNRRAAAARSAYFAQLAMRSAQTRQRSKKGAR